MAFGLTMQTERAVALQNAIQDELMRRGYSPDTDPVMAEYITIMIINNKTAAQISSELEDLIGADFDPTFVDWLFTEAAKGAPESEESPVPAPAQPSVRDSPPHLPSDITRRPPSGPRSGAPLYQQAITQALPSGSPTAHKRAASARSPSPTGHANKIRRMDLPTGPRAMAMTRENGAREGSAREASNSRSLLERVGPIVTRNDRGRYVADDVQARIDNITSNSAEAMLMNQMANGGFPMNGMGAIDMSAMAGIANPMVLQEMMMNQMALMSQMAGAMGLMNPGMMNAPFPMQQDPAMFNGNGGMGGFQQMGGMDGVGSRGRGRGRGLPAGRGMARRGQPSGHFSASQSTDTIISNGFPSSPTLSVPGLPATLPVPTPIPTTTPTAASSTPAPAPAPAVPTRSSFVPPLRPQSPTLCKYGLKCSNPLCRWSHPSPVATAESGVVLSNEACENGKDCKDKDCIKAHVSPAVLNPNAAEHLKPSGFVPPPSAVPNYPHSYSQTLSQTPCRFGAACTRPGCSYQHPAESHRYPPNGAKNHFAQPCRFAAACTRAACPFQHPEGRVLPSTFHRGLSTTAPIVSVPTPETGSIGAPSPHKSVTFNSSSGTTASRAAELQKRVKEMEARKNEVENAVKQAEAGKKDEAATAVPIAA